MPKTAETPSLSFALAPRPALRRKRERTAEGQVNCSLQYLNFLRQIVKKTLDAGVKIE